jgi:hypothetical protein
MIHEIEPRFEQEELEALTDDQLIDLQEYAESNPPHKQTYTEGDYQSILHEVLRRFKSS